MSLVQVWKTLKQNTGEFLQQVSWPCSNIWLTSNLFIVECSTADSQCVFNASNNRHIGSTIMYRHYNRITGNIIYPCLERRLPITLRPGLMEPAKSEDLVFWRRPLRDYEWETEDGRGSRMSVPDVESDRETARGKAGSVWHECDRRLGKARRPDLHATGSF